MSDRGQDEQSVDKRWCVVGLNSAIYKGDTMSITRDFFNDFIERLKHHNTGAGLKDHCTSNPIFIVQCLRKINGIDLDYDPLYYWTDEDREVELTDDELMEELAEYVNDGGEYEKFDPNYDRYVLCGNRVIYEKIGYAENWEYVNAHFTRESAEAFIKRKSHDYEKLRIYIDSQYWCPEFNIIVEGLLSGKIGLLSLD